MSAVIPIVGQRRLTVHNWVSVINGQCDCGAYVQVLGSGATQCQKCGTLYSLHVLEWNAAEPNNTNIQIRWQRPIAVADEAKPS